MDHSIKQKGIGDGQVHEGHGQLIFLFEESGGFREQYMEMDLDDHSGLLNWWRD